MFFFKAESVTAICYIFKLRKFHAQIIIWNKNNTSIVCSFNLIIKSCACCLGIIEKYALIQIKTVNCSDSKPIVEVEEFRQLTFFKINKLTSD